jgi:hypothetical protein
MYKKYQKNWEEIRRLRGYVRDKYKPVYVPLKMTKMMWVGDLICFTLFGTAFISLLWLYVTEHNSSLIVLLFFLGAFWVITALHLWKFKSVFRNSDENTKEQNELQDDDKTD